MHPGAFPAHHDCLARLDVPKEGAHREPDVPERRSDRREVLDDSLPVRNHLRHHPWCAGLSARPRPRRGAGAHRDRRRRYRRLRGQFALRSAERAGRSATVLAVAAAMAEEQETTGALGLIQPGRNRTDEEALLQHARQATRGAARGLDRRRQRQAFGSFVASSSPSPRRRRPPRDARHRPRRRGADGRGEHEHRERAMGEAQVGPSVAA